MSKGHNAHRDDKYQLKAIHGSTMNDEETLIPMGKLQLAPKQYYTHVHQHSCLYILQQHKG